MFQKSRLHRPARSCYLPRICLATLLSLAALPAVAGVVSIGQGSSVSTGSGQIDLNCGDAAISGGLSGSLTGARDVSIGPGADLAGSSVGLSGDWVNNGPRELGTQIDWRDGCGVVESRMLGSSDVAALTIDSQTGREVRFDTGGEQRVDSSLSLTGSAGNRLRLRSTSPTQLASLALGFGASQVINAVDVARIDSSAGQGIAPGSPEDYNSLRSGLVRNWFELPAIPVPSLGSASILLLILLTGLVGLFHRRFTRTRVSAR